MDLSIKQKQRLLITPQMQLAMNILQLNNLELAEYISALALENPVIEAEMPSAISDTEKIDFEFAKMEWLDNTDEHNRGEFFDAFCEDERKGYDPPAPEGETLGDCLYFQLLPFGLDETSLQIASRIIDSLDDNGYLGESLEYIANSLRTEISSAEAVLSLIQRCEPIGVGARDLRECLSIQLRVLGLEGHPALRIVQSHLDDLAHNRISYIAQELGLPIESVADARQLILGLDPKPAKNFSTSKPQYISADVCVENMEGEYVPFINDSRVPMIHISSFYRRLASHTNDAQVKRYLSGKFRQANWAIKCIEQRNSTILKSIQKLIEVQRDFFDSGPSRLIPMTLSDISDSIEMHISTVSRTFKGKYLQCSWGLFPLSFFLSPGIKGNNPESFSSQAVKAEMRTLISLEDRRKPRSDEEIAVYLRKKGMDISRRTVAKYRDELGILSSKLRKEY